MPLAVQSNTCCSIKCLCAPGLSFCTVLLCRHVEDRWPRKLALTLTTSGNPPRSATRSTTFPTPALAAATAAAYSPEKAAEGTSGSAAPSAAAAFAAPGVVGEKRYAVGSALHAAVVQLAAGLAQVREGRGSWVFFVLFKQRSTLAGALATAGKQLLAEDSTGVILPAALALLIGMSLVKQSRPP